MLAHANARKCGRSAECILTAEADRKDQQLRQGNNDAYVFIDSHSPTSAQPAAHPPERPSRFYDPGAGRHEQPAQMPTSMADGQGRSHPVHGMTHSLSTSLHVAPVQFHTAGETRQAGMPCDGTNGASLTHHAQLNCSHHGSFQHGQDAAPPANRVALEGDDPQVIEDSEGQADQATVKPSAGPRASLQLLQVEPPAQSGLMEWGAKTLQGAAAGALAIGSSFMKRVSPPRKHPDSSAAAGGKPQAAATSNPGPALSGQQPRPITSPKARRDAPFKSQQGTWHGLAQPSAPAAGFLPSFNNALQGLSLPDATAFSGFGGYPLPQKDRRAGHEATVLAATSQQLVPAAKTALQGCKGCWL